MNSASLAAATEVSFTLNNNQLKSTDFLYIEIIANGSPTDYNIKATVTGDGTATIRLRNITAAPLSQALTLRGRVDENYEV